MKKLMYLSLVLIVLVSCETIERPKPTLPNSPTREVQGSNDEIYTIVNSKEGEDPKILNFDNGVYYFEYTHFAFAKALSKFIGDHPHLEFVNSTGDNLGVGQAYGGTNKGYFVVFREKD